MLMWKEILIAVLIVIIHSVGLLAGENDCISNFIAENGYLINYEPIKVINDYFSCSEDKDMIILFQNKSLSKNEHPKENYIIITRVIDGRLKALWKSPKSPVWDIALANVDGGNDNELMICFWKKELYDDHDDNRLQVYAWNGDSLYAKWRGTFLSKPFSNVLFKDMDFDGTAELISIEKSRKNEFEKYSYICIYKWYEFGFEGLKQFCIDGKVDTIKESGSQLVIESSLGQKYTIINKDNNYEIVKEETANAKK